MNRTIAWVLVLLVVLVGTSCSLTEDRHFGVSRSANGDLYTWFVQCVSPPLSVDLSEYSAGEGYGQTLWSLAWDGKAPYPTEVRIGDQPEGYRLRVPLRVPPAAETGLRLSFASGEAWGEHIDFRPRDLPSNGDVLTADGRRMTPERFTSQPCMRRA